MPRAQAEKPLALGRSSRSGMPSPPYVSPMGLVFVDVTLPPGRPQTRSNRSSGGGPENRLIARRDIAGNQTTVLRAASAAIPAQHTTRRGRWTTSTYR